eukprot:TRINITY_DN31513_c0_g2_i1.p1 TRINITY_DN31513_c0_g2~~TRINITY_DN31513_c0_g2_i1.p1  ORF type:complete len:1129 (+),score=275.99 TRINITY_DN31513_c0_g2_i1:39-3425(+)
MEEKTQFAKYMAEMTMAPKGYGGGVGSRCASRADSASPCPSRRPNSKERAQREGMNFQERLSTLLSMQEGARTLALKLYARFGGHASALPKLAELLEERWGFPGRLLPLLWTQLRRTVFRHRGAEVPMQRLLNNFEVPEFVDEEEWVEAFERWLEALQTRCGQNKVSRRSLVRRHLERDGVSEEDYYFQGPKLGEGAYGEVFVMFHKRQGQRAVKKIHKAQLSADALCEVNVLKALDHPHIVRIYEAFERQETLHIAMDWAEGGTLASLLAREQEQGRNLAEKWVCTASHQMCAALEYMHHKGVIHCDLKPENAMLLRPSDPSRGEVPHIVLVDFGISDFVEARKNVGPIQFRGTPLYVAPEGFEGHLTEKSDLWALGIMIVEMLTGRRSFQAPNIVLLMCRIMQSEPSLEGLGPLAQEVVLGCLVKDPIARLTAQECRSLSWFAPANQLQPAEPAKTCVTLQAYGEANRFQRVAMFAVATGLSMKDMEDVFQVFQSIDKNKSGYLDFEQFATGLRHFGITEDPRHLMSILDLDQNGRISYTEFLAGMLANRADSLSEKRVREAFDVFDLDGDGCISLSELRVMLSGEGPLVEVLPTGQTVDEVMQEVANGDEQISFEAFLEYLSDLAAGLRTSSFKKTQAEQNRRRSKQEQARDLVSNMLQELDDTAGAGQALQSTASRAAPEADGQVTSPSEKQLKEMENARRRLCVHCSSEMKPDGDDVLVCKNCGAKREDADVDDKSEDEVFWRAWGKSRNQWSRNRKDYFGEYEGEPSKEDLPPLHRFLLDTCGDPSTVLDQATCIHHLLAFPAKPLSPEACDLLAANMSHLSKHYLAAVSLVRLLAEGSKKDDRQLPKASELSEGFAQANLRQELRKALDEAAAAAAEQQGKMEQGRHRTASVALPSEEEEQISKAVAHKEQASEGSGRELPTQPPRPLQAQRAWGAAPLPLQRQQPVQEQSSQPAKKLPQRRISPKAKKKKKAAPQTRSEPELADGSFSDLMEQLLMGSESPEEVLTPAAGKTPVSHSPALSEAAKRRPKQLLRFEVAEDNFTPLAHSPGAAKMRKGRAISAPAVRGAHTPPSEMAQLPRLLQHCVPNKDAVKPRRAGPTVSPLPQLGRQALPALRRARVS